MSVAQQSKSASLTLSACKMLRKYEDKENNFTNLGVDDIIRNITIDYSCSKTNQMHQYIRIIYFRMILYMFRTVFPSIIRSSRLYIQQEAFVKQILLSAC